MLIPLDISIHWPISDIDISSGIIFNILLITYTIQRFGAMIVDKIAKCKDFIHKFTIIHTDIE
ncbi:hypothetical protein CBR56_29095 [Bacillus thuringiensis]|nr:hypothetical protein CBR56_29095 [Bacillus thuringiensis]